MREAEQKLRLEVLTKELAAANDSIERSKDYECELRAEVERLTEGRDQMMIRHAEAAKKWRTRITELEAEVERLTGQANNLKHYCGEYANRITELEGALEQIVKGSTSYASSWQRELAVEALAQEKK